MHADARTIVLFLVPMMVAQIAQAETIIPAANRIEARIVRTISIEGEDAMHMPTDVAVDSHSRVFIVDTRDRVLCFNAEGKLELVITNPDGQKLNKPVGLAVDKKDQLWIADTGNHRVLAVSGKGKLLETIDLPKSANDQPVNPTDVAVTADGKRVYVVDNDGHRLLVRESAGVWTILGRFGRALGQFQWPFMIDIGPRGHVYVSEVIGASVQRISADDLWAGRVGQWGVQMGQFYRPKGVAVDNTGRSYVSDSTLQVVQVFSPDGDFMGVLTDSEGKPLRFAHPMGMCFDAKGQLYVVELEANRVAIVSLPESGTTTKPAKGEVSR